MSKFGWSYPAGCDGVPADEPCFCEICGRDPDDCQCPTCPVCANVGRAACVAEHGLVVEFVAVPTADCPAHGSSILWPAYERASAGKAVEPVDLLLGEIEQASEWTKAENCPYMSGLLARAAAQIRVLRSYQDWTALKESHGCTGFPCPECDAKAGPIR